MSEREDIDDLEELSTLISNRDEKVERPASRTSSTKARVADEPQKKDSAVVVQNTQMWAVYGGRNFSACEKAVSVLPPGQYTIDSNNAIGLFFRKEEVNLDELIMLPDSKSQAVIDEVERFWTLEQKFRDFGFLWKRGVLLWGPPGSGKTTTLQVISKNIIDKGGISVYIDEPEFCAVGLKVLRQVEPKRPVVIMLEDIDAIIDHYGEAELLALMDGELQIDNVVFIATTNYPDRLDKRFVNRPSRFDIVKKIGMPSEKARRVYLLAKNKRLGEKKHKSELDEWVTLSKGFSIAHLKELIVSVEVFGQTLTAAVARLRKMGEMRLSDTNTGSVGFMRSFEVEDDGE